MQPFGIENDSLDRPSARPAHADQPDGDPPVELTLVTMRFDAADEAKVAAVLAAYVVTSRSEPGCRNIDLCVGVSDAARFVIVEKWESPDAQRRHFDSDAMVRMARACEGLLVRAPDIELLEGISAHDLA